MFLASNLQYLRKKADGMTQEKLAQQLGVSRQTVSKWESGEAQPEIGNLMELCEIFSCKADDLLRVDMTERMESAVRIVRVESFRMARYIIFSSHAEKDVCTYMDSWAKSCGLLTIPGFTGTRIHWGFPYVTAEQKNRFKLRGHAAAYILPGDFEPKTEGPDVIQQSDATYAVMTVKADSMESLPESSQIYSLIMEYLADNKIAKCADEDYLHCFEREYRKNGTAYKDVFVHCQDSDPKEKFRFEI